MDISTIILYDLDDQREISFNVRDLLQQEEVVQGTPNNNVNNTKKIISVAKLFEKCLSIWPKFDFENLAFIVDGKIERTNKECIHINQTVKVLYCLRLSQEIQMENLQIDPISLKAAAEWVDTMRPEDIPKHSELSQLIAAMKVNEPEVVAPPQNPNANNPPQNQVINFFQVIQWRLIIRMCVIFYIFTGGRGQDEKKYFMAALFFCCYLLQVGFLGYLLEKLRNVVGNPIPPPNRDPNQPQPAQPAAVGFVDYLRGVITNGIEIPQSPGLVYDFLAFFIGLVASIFPSWEPQAFPLPQPPAVEPAAVDGNVNDPPQQEQQPPQQQQQPPAAGAGPEANANNDNPQVMNFL